MNAHENIVTPILIGFDLSSEPLERVLQLNQELDKTKVNFGQSIPHVTLWMGFVKSKHLAPLSLGLTKIFHDITLQTMLGELTKFENDLGSVWSWEVKKNRELDLLQNRIHHFFEPFREKCAVYEGLNESSTAYVNDFAQKSLEHYDPHITIGFGDLKPMELSSLPITLSDPKMFFIGNYCTCREEIQ